MISCDRNLPLASATRHRGLGGPDIHGDDHALVVEAQKGRPAPARQAARGALQHPMFGYQLLDNQRDRAALEAR